MRIFVSAFICALMCALAAPQAAGAASLTIDGEPIPGAVAQNGHLFVPFRAAMQRIGAVPAWSSFSQTGSATAMGREVVRTTIGSRIADLSGDRATLGVAPVLIGADEYVPVEMLPEISNAKLTLSAAGDRAEVTNFDIAGIDAAGARAASGDPRGGLLTLWLWLLPISAIVAIAGYVIANGKVQGWT